MAKIRQDRHLGEQFLAEVAGAEPHGGSDRGEQARDRQLQRIAAAHQGPLRTGTRPAGLSSRISAIRA